LGPIVYLAEVQVHVTEIWVAGTNTPFTEHVRRSV
jgi:hypothetical protein